MAVPTPPPCSGALITSLDEKFDGVIPPDLPPFWTAINGIDPDGVLWQTSNSGLPSPPYDTAPNAAWVNDPPVISDKYLGAPAEAVSSFESSYVRLTFRHNYNLEASESDPNLGFDGGVLELSIDGGNTFQDITQWGSFESGGYTRTIATDRGSPIAGRPAWSGNSGGFITTVVNLPQELVNTVLRWRMASDNTGSSEGWRVDTANVVWCHFFGTPTPTPTPQSLQNISTRLSAGTGDNVLIGGFITTGNAPKKVLLRAIGPSLTDLGLTNVLADPVLELHEPDGTVVTNDNWKDTQETEIEATTIAPTNDLESAILVTLDPVDPAISGSGVYTAIVKGNNDGTGVALVEVYDLDQGADSQLANISTRGFVQGGDDVMIGGVIIGKTSDVLLRAIGPELTQLGVSNALQDTTLELHDHNGVLITSNDDWKESQQAEIEATGIPPQDDRESAILMTLQPSSYTAIVRGKNDTTGVALVEAYQLGN